MFQKETTLWVLGLHCEGWWSIVQDKVVFHATSWWLIKWKHFPRYWPFVRGIHRSPVSFPHKGQWRGAVMFSLICAWINRLVNNRKAGDLRRYRAHYDVIVMAPPDAFYAMPWFIRFENAHSINKCALHISCWCFQSHDRFKLLCRKPLSLIKHIYEYIIEKNIP